MDKQNLNAETEVTQEDAEKMFHEFSRELRGDNNPSTPEDTADEPEKTPANEPEEVEGKESPAKEGGEEEEGKAGEAPAEDDPLAGADEKTKALIEELRQEKARLQKMRSELGRVPYLQRTVDELRRQLSESRKFEQEPATRKTALPSQGKFAERLAQIKEVDPVLAETLEAMAQELINPLREEVGKEIQQTKQMFASKQQEELWYSEKAKLLERVPQADQVFSTPLWKEWKESQPENIYNLASSIYADEVEVAIQLFAKWVEQNHPELVQPKTPPQSDATQQTQPNPAAKIAQEARERKLKAQAPKSTATTPAFGEGLPDDEEALFRLYSKKIRNGEI